jgi:hypothetical protein
VLNISGVLRYVYFKGKALAIPEKQIRVVMNLLEQDMEVEEVRQLLYKGSNIEITGGGH